MNKKMVKLLLAVVVLALLAGGYVLVQKKASGGEADSSQATDVQYLLGTDITQETFSYLSFTDKDGQALEFDFEDGDWYYMADKSFVVNSESISSLFSSLISPTINREITSPEDLSEYGLDQPTNVISYKTKEGTEGTVTLGSTNPTTKDVYLYKDGDTSVVYCVSSDLATAYSISLEDMRSDAAE